MDKITTIIILLIGLVVSSCELNSIYEEKIDFVNNTWHEDSIKTLNFELIEDGNYDIFYIIKNKNDYPFSNLYIKSDLRSESEQIVNNLQEVTLFDKKTGEPYGKGFGGVLEHKFYSLKNQFLPKGKYTLTVQQYMRQSEVTGIMAFGIDVAKSSE